MDDRTKTAFTSAADCAKQLIALATGILTLEITFIKNVLESPSEGTKHLLVASWIMFLVSIIAGVWTLLALTGTLGKAQEPKYDSIYARNVTLPAMGQIALFLLGLVLTVFFGCAAI